MVIFSQLSFFKMKHKRSPSCNNLPDVVEAVVLQRVMHLVADYWPCVVLRGRMNAGLLVRVWVRRVGQGRCPQQGRGRDRGRRLLLPLDAEGWRGLEARSRRVRGRRSCSGGWGARWRRGRDGAGQGRREEHLAVLLLAAMEPRYFG